MVSSRSNLKADRCINERTGWPTDRPRWNSACHSAVPVSRVVWNPKDHCRVYNSPPLYPIINQINTVHTLPHYLFKMHFNIILLCMPWSYKTSLPWDCTPNTRNAFLNSSIRAIFLALHLMFLTDAPHNAFSEPKCFGTEIADCPCDFSQYSNSVRLTHRVVICTSISQTYCTVFV